MLAAKLPLRSTGRMEDSSVETAVDMGATSGCSRRLKLSRQWAEEVLKIMREDQWKVTAEGPLGHA